MYLRGPILAAAQLLATMKSGLNLGNTLDTATHSTDPAVMARRLDAIRAEGYGHVRIPVSWRPADFAVCRIDVPEFVDKVESAVDHAIGLGLVVIVNAHHEQWLTRYDGSKAMTDEFTSMWRRIATRFRDKPQNKLVFEVLNEPHGTMGGGGGFGGSSQSPEALALTRKLNAAGYTGIRSVSRRRVVLIQPNDMGSMYQAGKMWPTPEMLPGGGRDQYLAVTLHSYAPWAFVGPNGSDSAFASQKSLEADIAQRFESLLRWMQSVPVPVHIGEFGVGRVNRWLRDSDMVRAYYRCFSARARDAGIPAAAWDDGGDFAITKFNRDATSIQFVYGISEALLSSASPDRQPEGWRDHLVAAVRQEAVNIDGDAATSPTSSTRDFESSTGSLESSTGGVQSYTEA
ncbi:glycoside hydrolase superfamily [Tribonema minus]|uniref:Glycoside hydrolase superfamily n=1 Tax=Tribonema minus TaxID=303371 RepID=A0A836CEX1_9STRA|nr:glycoside hydrolase superfamily [Tribonema minus]